MTASLGTLISFLRKESSAAPGSQPIQEIQSATANFAVSQWLSDPPTPCAGAQGTTVAENQAGMAGGNGPLDGKQQGGGQP
jgi:hypothetical protein